MSREPIEPQILEDESKLPKDLIALRNLGILLDRAFAVPGTKRRVGIAPIIGLVPGIGDFIAAMLSTWIVVGALRHRVPAGKIIRMVLNIIVDAAVGTIPIIGDTFDFLFQENLSNVETLLRHRDRTRPPRTNAQIALVAMAIVIIILIVIILMIILLIFLLAKMIDALHVLLTG